MDKVGTKYCILENDGVSLCVCKHRPCEQLQRAKAESKELERKYTDVLKLAKENADSNEYCLQELEQENERLKEKSKEKAVITKAYNDLVIEIISNIPYAGEIRPDNITPLDVLGNIKKERKTYKQALQEIREIVSEQCQQCFVIDSFTKPDDCGICDYKRILDKINEVIGEE